MNVEDEIRDFVVKELGFRGSPAELTSEFPLIEHGVLNSMGILQVVGMVEDRFGVEIADEELVRQNFETIGSIAHLVEAKAPS